MHDNQLEDRVRAALRAEGEELPLTITSEELERRQSVRRRERRNRRFSLVAACVGVVALGWALALSTGWLRASDVGSPPSPQPSSSAMTTPSTTNPPATVDLDCSALDRTAADQPPTVVLGLHPGDSIPHFGALGAYQLGNRQAGEPGGWTSVDRDGLDPIRAGPPSQNLSALAGSDYTCLAGVSVEAVPIEDVSATPVLLAGLSSGPARSLEFALPPVGEWLVRVHAEFLTGNGSEAWSETFFRVDARNPAASLGPILGGLPLLNSPPATTFVDEHSDNLDPTDATGISEEWVVGQVPPRNRYVVFVVCLGSSPMRWSIGHEGQPGFLAAGDQPCDGTYSEHAVEHGIPTADQDVVLQGDPATVWRVLVAAFEESPALIPPALRLWLSSDAEGPDGSIESFGRCVSTPDRPEPCGGEWFDLDGARGIVIPVGSSVTVALEGGWEIAEARVTAVVTDQVLLVDPYPPEYSVGFVETGGSKVTVPIELGRGNWIVRVALNAEKDGATFGGHYDFRIHVGD